LQFSLTLFPLSLYPLDVCFPLLLVMVCSLAANLSTITTFLGWESGCGYAYWIP
jgi:hypothetical protein